MTHQTTACVCGHSAEDHATVYVNDSPTSLRGHCHSCSCIDHRACQPQPRTSHVAVRSGR